MWYFFAQMLKLSCRVGFPATSADRTLLIFLGFLMLRVYFVSVCPSSPPPTPGDEVEHGVCPSGGGHSWGSPTSSSLRLWRSGSPEQQLLRGRPTPPLPLW